MKQSYTFSVKGMTCHACEKLITMDLEDAGFTPASIDQASGELNIEIEPADVECVTQAVQASGTYTVSEVKPNN